MLNRNSYCRYLILVTVIGVFGTLLLNTNLPAVLKWLALVNTTQVDSNMIRLLCWFVWAALA